MDPPEYVDFAWLLLLVLGHCLPTSKVQVGFDLEMGLSNLKAPSPEVAEKFGAWGLRPINPAP